MTCEGSYPGFACRVHRCRQAAGHAGGHQCACSFYWSGLLVEPPSPPGRQTGRWRHRARLTRLGLVGAGGRPVRAVALDDGRRPCAGRGPTADDVAAWESRSELARALGYRRARAGAEILRWLRG